MYLGKSRVLYDGVYKIFSRNISSKEPIVDQHLIDHLKNLALVNFPNSEAVERLADAIKFADKLMKVDVSNVTPMISPFEDRVLLLREDVISEGNCKDSILRNAKKTYEDYFLAPPGNIPLNKVLGEGQDEIKVSI